MTKQQLLALLREAYKEITQGMCENCQGYSAYISSDEFIAEVERTNKVGDLGLPEFNDWVKCNEKMPSRGLVVLTIGSHLEPITAYCTSVGWYAFEDDNFIVGVTHWQYIQQPDNE